MAISYPIAFPTAQGFTRVTIAPRSAVALYASPFTGQQQVYQHPGQFLTASIELPPMKREQAADVAATLMALQGKRGTFYFGDPAWATPQGIGTGPVPRINAGGQSGNTIATTGWTASQSPILRAGDWVQIGNRNLLLRSAEFDNAAWSKGDVTVTPNDTTAPDGAATADKVVASATTTRHRVSRGAGIGPFAAGTAVTLSFYAKAAELAFVAMSLIRAASSDGASAIFDLANLLHKPLSVGANNVMSAQIFDAGGGWRRCTMTVTNSVNELDFVSIGLSDSYSPAVDGGSRLPSFTGDGTSGAYFWGAQLEVGSFPRGYQPTTTTAVELAPQLSCVVQNAASNASGEATLELVPRVRTAFAAGTPITVTNPWGLWRMVDDGSFVQDVGAITRGIVINAVEAF